MVYCETGSSIKKVFIDGQLIAENGNILTINEQELLAELRTYISKFTAKFEETIKCTTRLYPHLKEMYEKCIEKEDQLNRFSSN